MLIEQICSFLKTIQFMVVIVL